MQTHRDLGHFMQVEEVVVYSVYKYSEVQVSGYFVSQAHSAGEWLELLC